MTIELISYFFAIIMGGILGLMGGGGSILSVPILVYLLGIEPILATAYSLFIVGVSSLIGSIKKHQEGMIDWRNGIAFAIPSVIAVFLTRYAFLPILPDTIIEIGDFVLSKNLMLMLFFGIMMLMASFSMIRGVKIKYKDRVSPNIPLIILEGAIVGFLTGLVGAGGGFLIVPALVLFVNMDIKKAIGTSLLIISLKSLVGFLGDVGSGQAIDWYFLLRFTSFSVLGIFIGIKVNAYISARSLKKSFGYFVLIMGIIIILKELLT